MPFGAAQRGLAARQVHPPPVGHEVDDDDLAGDVTELVELGGRAVMRVDHRAAEALGRRALDAAEGRRRERTAGDVDARPAEVPHVDRYRFEANVLEADGAHLLSQVLRRGVVRGRARETEPEGRRTQAVEV